MGLKSVRVVRVGHRYVRDYRTLTHLCLVSRALGAESIYLEEVEKELQETVAEVNRTWGGDFSLVEAKWKPVFQEAKAEGRVIVHLTMYGSPLQDEIGELRKRDSFLIAVGGPKVPGEVYRTGGLQRRGDLAAPLGGGGPRDHHPRPAKGGRA